MSSIWDGFKDPELCRGLLSKIESELKSPLRFMEVCGTHTVSIFQSGLNSLFPKDIVHVSGPGCPVCVTHESEVALYLQLAGMDNVILATFGDLLRVPGPKGANLKSAKADGARVEIIYSPSDAVKLAQDNPDALVVFLGIGFETTAPTVAATIKIAKAQGVENFTILSFHKLVPPALQGLLAGGDVDIDAFILPGHVSVIIGLEPYQFLAKEYNVPSVITGFDPLDILQALLSVVQQHAAGKAEALNLYGRAVSDKGNPKALEILYEVFEPADALWRGIGMIPGSGLVVREEYEQFDAMKRLGVTLPDTKPLPGCKCGDVLKGKMRPDECPLFRKACTPANPVGPCMVSTEGSCAAYFKYKLD